MRKWMVLAALVVAIVAGVLLVRGGRSAPPAAPPPATPDASPPTAPGAGAGMEHGAAATPEGHGTGDQEDVVDENVRLVRAHPVTMKRLEAYVAAVKEIRAAGEKDATLLARLREPRPRGELPGGMARRLEGIGPVGAILTRHRLTGLDLVIMPQAMLQARNDYALEQEGRPNPAERTNAAAVGVYRSDLPKVDALVKAFTADLRVIQGRPAAAR